VKPVTVNEGMHMPSWYGIHITLVNFHVICNVNN